MKSLILLAIGASSVSALSYQPLVTIPWAPSNSTSVDQSIIYNGTYYLADRTNKGVHVVNLTTNKQIGLIQGFRGLPTLKGKPNDAEAGPDGLLILPDRKELYVGDGNGILKVIDLATNTITANITLNSTERVDEMAYDPETGIVVCTIPYDTPPRVAIIAANNRTVKGYITFHNASSLKQPAWNSVDKQFYISVPSTKTDPGGAVAIIDVKSLAITRILPLPKCIPAGIVFGPQQNLFISCGQYQIPTYNISNSLIMHVTTGHIIANISGVSGVGQVAYDSNAGYYYASAYKNLASGITTGAPEPLLAVIDANANKLFQNIVTDNVTAQSVAVDPTTKNLIVPISNLGLVVYSLTPNSTADSTSISSGTPAASPTTSSKSSGIVSKTVIDAFYYIVLALFAGIILF